MFTVRKLSFFTCCLLCLRYFPQPLYLTSPFCVWLIQDFFSLRNFSWSHPWCQDMHTSCLSDVTSDLSILLSVDLRLLLSPASPQNLTGPSRCKCTVHAAAVRPLKERRARRLRDAAILEATAHLFLARECHWELRTSHELLQPSHWRNGMTVSHQHFKKAGNQRLKSLQQVEISSCNINNTLIIILDLTVHSCSMYVSCTI